VPIYDFRFCAPEAHPPLAEIYNWGLLVAHVSRQKIFCPYIQHSLLLFNIQRFCAKGASAFGEGSESARSDHIQHLTFLFSISRFFI
jgi:hypothetical protein